MGVMLIFLLLILTLAILCWRGWAKRQKRRQLLSSVLAPEDWAIVTAMVPLVRNLPHPLKIRLQGKMNLFLDQVQIYGKNGLVVDRGMELSLAAQACLLVVNSDAWYKTLKTVLLYPGAFRSPQQTHAEFIVTEHNYVNLGESWHRGPVVLSWPHAEQGGKNQFDGQNLVLHEFAHQLDSLSGSTDGVPVLMAGQSYQDWEAAIITGYDNHVANVERNRKTVLDPYAATNYVEFLAVSMEVFFEKPKKFKKEYPDVYKQISILLSLDPLDWADGAGG